MKSPVKKIVIVGRDADAWITALTLQRSFIQSSQKVEVVLIELPSHLHPQDFYAVLPGQKILHKILGLNEGAVLKASGGLYALGQRFSNWCGASTPFLHAYDTHGYNFLDVDFVQYWLRAYQKGLRVPLEDFSVGAVSAKQGKFIAFENESATFSKATYGYNLSASDYIKIIAKGAVTSGVSCRSSELKSVKIENGQIKSITLADDSVIDGDFFIDATGSKATLLSHLEQNNFESWEEWFPCDRVAVASAVKLSPPPAFSQISAFSEGWIGIYPLLNRTAISVTYSSKLTNYKIAFEKAVAISGMKITDIVESELIPGTRKESWIGNCLALGNSSVNLETLDATQLHILHVGLSLLRSLFPTDKNFMPESEIFNEKIYRHAVNVRDFQIAHYKLNKRFGEKLWDEARNMTPPTGLAEKLRLFESRGRVAMFEDETFQEESWTSLFIGQGLIARNYDPLVEKMSEAEQMDKFKQLLSHVATEVQKMPSLEQYVELIAN